MVFLLLMVAIGIAGFFYYEKLEHDFQSVEHNELASIADLKVHLIANWRKERLDDLSPITEIPLFAQQVRAFLSNPQDGEAQAAILSWMTFLKNHYAYEEVLLIDANSNVRLALPAGAPKPVVYTEDQQLVTEALQKRRAVLSDLHRDPTSGRIHFDVAAPLIGADSTGAPKPLGVVFAEIDPYAFLYPHIQSWPTPTKSAETLLARKEGGDVVFLNELRHRSNSVLSLRVPIAQNPALAAALAVSGVEGIIDGKDYRGVPVEAVLRKIPDSPWFLIAKIDTEEAYAPLRRQAWTTLLVVSLLMVAAGLGMRLLWQRREAGFVLRELASDRARLQSEQHYQDLVEHSPDAIFIQCEGCFAFINRAGLRLFGAVLANQILGHPILERVHPEYREIVARRIQTSREDRTVLPLIEEKYLRMDGSVVDVEVSATPITHDGKPAAQVIARDITARKSLEAQSLRNQRVQTIGMLASGIAHDLNNVLTPLLVTVPDLRERVHDEESSGLLDIIESGARRGANFIQQLLTFGRGAIEQACLMRPKTLIEEIAQLARETFPKSIRINVHCCQNSWLVSGDPTQLHQVLLNLAVNARDAMPAGGELNLSLDHAQLTKDQAEGKPGPYVILAVHDTGPGIPPEIREKIFDPFFTTKEIGKGTGLGLATSLNIVHRHGGFIQVSSEPGHGALFKVFLPAFTAKIENEAAIERPVPSAGHGELILVVDDEPLMREVARRVLIKNNYRVLTANDGEEAVSIYTRERERIQVILIDVLMPRMDGPTAMRALREINPEVPLIASSGMIPEELERELASLKPQAILPKPFSREELLAVITAALNAGSKKPQALPGVCS